MPTSVTIGGSWLLKLLLLWRKPHQQWPESLESSWVIWVCNLMYTCIFIFSVSVPICDRQERIFVIFSHQNSIPVPQILAMMVDLEEDPEWSTSDEVEEEDNDRWMFVANHYSRSCCSSYFFIRLSFYPLRYTTHDIDDYRNVIHFYWQQRNSWWECLGQTGLWAWRQNNAATHHFKHTKHACKRLV